MKSKETIHWINGSYYIPNGVAILQYADDTTVFLKHGIEGARNMKLLLYMYEMMAGLKMN